MNTSVSAYTTLESLLLFQCLRTYGVGNSVFGRISDLLKKNGDVTNHKSYQIGRLSPDALRNFYLERLRKEIENEQGADHDDTPNGDGANPRKRKKASPALPTVQESLQHQHLIPKLVNKLYASYRKEVTEQIRAEEDQYDKLQRDLKAIQRGEWDDQLRDRATQTASASRSPSTTKKSPNLAQKPVASPQPSQQAPVSASDAAQAQPPREAPKPVQNGQSSTSPKKKQATQDQQRAASTPQPPAASKSPTKLQQSQNPPYNGVPYANMAPYPPAQQAHMGPNQPLHSSPQQSSARPSQSRSPAAPPAGGPYPGPPQLQPYGNGGQYPGPHGIPYPPMHQPYHPPPGQQSPSPHMPSQPHRQPGYPQYGQPPPQAGFMLPPFQVSPQDPSRVHPQNTTPHQSQTSTPVSNRHQPQPPRANIHTPASNKAGAPPMHPSVVQARQSFSTPVSTRSTNSATGTPLSVKSKWKTQSISSTPVTVSPRPEPEPIDDFVPLPLLKQSPSRTKSQRKLKAKAKGKEKGIEPAPSEQTPQDAETPSAPQPEDPPTEPETRSGRSRRKAPPKRTRPGSIASSRAGGSVRDRSRSPSVLSHTDTVAADNDSQVGHRIKSERGNSVDVIEEEVTETPSLSTRRRGATSTRRKRNAREASLEETEDQFSTPGPPKTIIAPRYFARTSVPIMNDIQSHKHASTFGTAVRAKDAEGYYDIIKRPTDLKSISKAIANGSKQVAAAASDTPVGSPGGGGGVVELPVTLDNIPPKSIVNAAQLEKELMRMFANAVMFNPGEDGVVDDAREMFETVQRSVSSWRNVERSSGRTEVEDTPTIEEDEVQPAPSKRRKV